MLCLAEERWVCCAFHCWEKSQVQLGRTKYFYYWTSCFLPLSPGQTCKWCSCGNKLHRFTNHSVDRQVKLKKSWLVWVVAALHCEENVFSEIRDFRVEGGLIFFEGQSVHLRGEWQLENSTTMFSLCVEGCSVASKVHLAQTSFQPLSYLDNFCESGFELASRKVFKFTIWKGHVIWIAVISTMF